MALVTRAPNHKVLGFHSLTTSKATTATHTTYQDEGLTASVTYGANRILRVTWNGGIFASGGTNLYVKMKAIRGSTDLFEWYSTVSSNTIFTVMGGFTHTFNGPATAATETFKLQIAAATGTTAVQSSGTAAAPRTFLIEDLGPQ